MGRAAFQIALLAASWYSMMLVHELGHVLAAWATGSVIAEVRVPWLGFSQTEMVKYAEPAWVVVAAGPALGAFAPLASFGVLLAAGGRRRSPSCAIMLRFFAGFCLIANGAYMASALVSPVGDAEDLAALGTPRWASGVPGLLAVAAGLWAWNGSAAGLRSPPPRAGWWAAGWLGAALGIVAVV